MRRCQKQQHVAVVLPIVLPVFQTNVSKRLKSPTGGARTPLRAAAGNGVPALPIKSYAFAPMLLTFPYQMAKLQLQGRRETIRRRFAMARQEKQ